MIRAFLSALAVTLTLASTADAAFTMYPNEKH